MSTLEKETKNVKEALSLFEEGLDILQKDSEAHDMLHLLERALCLLAANSNFPHLWIEAFDKYAPLNYKILKSIDKAAKENDDE